MKKLFVCIIMLLPFTNIYASPYADDYLYEDILDYIENPANYSNNYVNGYVNNNPDIIVGAFIEKAFSVYKKEEKYTPDFKNCGEGCYKDEKAQDILNAYHKFFYMFAIAEEITSVLIQNPQVNDNIEYTLKNKKIRYKWNNKNKLVISIDRNTIEFVKQNKGVVIKTDMKSLEKYRLN